MKQLSIIIISLFAGSWCYSQDSVDNVNEYIYNYVYKNIAAFNIRYASYRFNRLVPEDILGGNAGDYDYVMPDHGYKLKMDIKRIDSVYPDPRFHLYKICVNQFEFIPDNPKLPIIGNTIVPAFVYYLVGLNERNGEIKYISGQFFPSYISADFHVNLKDPNSFIPYLNFRTFNVGGSNIRYKKKKRKIWIFEGYSTISERPFTMMVKRKNVDFTNIVIK